MMCEMSSGCLIIVSLFLILPLPVPRTYLCAVRHTTKPPLNDQSAGVIISAVMWAILIPIMTSKDDPLCTNMFGKLRNVV
jgi:hypothetical protein